MKNITSILMICALPAILVNCVKDKPIGPPIPLGESEYTLPQGGASQWAEDWILNMYENYGTYFLYKFDEKDFLWTQSVTTGSISRVQTPVMLNPEYVEEFIRFLEEAWLNLISDDRRKVGPESMLPYKIFLVENIRIYNPNALHPAHPDFPYQYTDFEIRGNALIFSYVSTVSDGNVGDPSTPINYRKGIHELTPAERADRRIELAQTIFSRYYQIQFPDEWFELTDYVTHPVDFMEPNAVNSMVAPHHRIYNGFGSAYEPGRGSIDDNPNSPYYGALQPRYLYPEIETDSLWPQILAQKIVWRNLGFLPRSYAPTNEPREWLTNKYNWDGRQTVGAPTMNRTNDRDSYEFHLFRRTDAQMEFYLETYPKIKEKWDALLKFYNDYGVDVRSIANSAITE